MLESAGLEAPLGELVTLTLSPRDPLLSESVSELVSCTARRLSASCVERLSPRGCGAVGAPAPGAVNGPASPGRDREARPSLVGPEGAAVLRGPAESYALQQWFK